jgi:3'-phosphoadenosine 5'-phosphosulfate sulfotransferase (PAPS reductase)/FAD synthetase
VSASNLVTLGGAARIDRGVETTPELETLLRAGSPVAIGVSGGKDSCVCALATVEHLDAIGHAGPRILVHSDLGRVEWKDSAPTCERLAAVTGLELVTVRRQAGDMMDRWLGRWSNNVARYVALSCVKLILPWSTPSMRFCTSELKSAVIASALVKRFSGSFPGTTILSASGIRRAESANRAKAPTFKPNPRLKSAKHHTIGLDWNPIAHWSTPDVYAFLAARGFRLHEAYTRYGNTRVSCAFCIMGSEGDLMASSTCEDNAAVYREMVDLEIVSTFAFQGDRWLGDVAPHLLSDAQRARLIRAKLVAAQRQAIEARIPKHLLYVKGWPTVMPTRDEAVMLSEVRREIATLLDFGPVMTCTDPDSILGRYADLMAQARAKGRGVPLVDDTEDNDEEGTP